MVGKKFNNLTVLEETEQRTNSGNKVYKCLCDCGNITYVSGVDLRKNRVKSCGCLHSTINKLSKHKLYRTYMRMKRRCYNKNDEHYKYYGDRGITICQDWLNDFMKFYNWSINNGYKDNLTIDRIDVNGNYEPSNCRWVDMKHQANNKRNNVCLTYNGKTQTIARWANELHINSKNIYNRYYRGWSDKECLIGRNKNDY